MKIFLVLPNLAGGGAERVNLDLAHEFKRLGYEVSFLLKNANGIFLDEAKNNFDVIDLNTKSNVLFATRLSYYIDYIKPTAVIASMWGLTAFSSLSKLISKHNFKLLLVEHSSLISQFKNSSLKIKLWLRVSTFLAYRIADAVAGVSAGVANDMKKVASLRDRPATLHNPVPVTCGLDKKVIEKSDFKTIVTAGRLIEAKDYPTLLRAFSILNSRLSVRLLILGQGPLLSMLQSLVREYGLEEKVVFEGFVFQPRDYFLHSDLFVLSSQREGFGNVIVEALGCGLPVVATDCNYGPAEILSGGEYGKLVPVGDSLALADAMFRSLTTEHDKLKLINRAENFTPEKVVKRYLDVLGFSYK